MILDTTNSIFGMHSNLSGYSFMIYDDFVNIEHNKYIPFIVYNTTRRYIRKSHTSPYFKGWQQSEGPVRIYINSINSIKQNKINNIIYGKLTDTISYNTYKSYSRSTLKYIFSAHFTKSSTFYAKLLTNYNYRLFFGQGMFLINLAAGGVPKLVATLVVERDTLIKNMKSYKLMKHVNTHNIKLLVDNEFMERKYIKFYRPFLKYTIPLCEKHDIDIIYTNNIKAYIYNKNKLIPEFSTITEQDNYIKKILPKFEIKLHEIEFQEKRS